MSVTTDWRNAIHSCLIVAAVCLVSGCGIVRWREVEIIVRDKETNAPIPSASVSRLGPGHFCQFNAAKYPYSESGSTNEQGVWHTHVAIGDPTSLNVNVMGYQERLMQFDEVVFDKEGRCEVLLVPSGKEDSESPPKIRRIDHDTD